MNIGEHSWSFWIIQRIIFEGFVDWNNFFLQVAEVKKNIESVQGADVYPAAQLMLIHQGKVLKDETTLEENKVAENSFVVVMLTKVSLYKLFKSCCHTILQ